MRFIKDFILKFGVELVLGLGILPGTFLIIDGIFALNVFGDKLDTLGLIIINVAVLTLAALNNLYGSEHLVAVLISFIPLSLVLWFWRWSKMGIIISGVLLLLLGYKVAKYIGSVGNMYCNSIQGGEEAGERL